MRQVFRFPRLSFLGVLMFTATILAGCTTRHRPVGDDPQSGYLRRSDSAPVIHGEVGAFYGQSSGRR